MPRKKPWTTTASGTWTPKAWKEAQRTPMLAAQKPAAPSTARPPGAGWAKRPSAKRKPSPTVAGTLRRASPGVERSLAVRVGERARPAREVGRDQRDENAEDEQQAGDAGRDDRQLDRVLAVHHPGAQQDPEDDQRERVEGVMEGEEGDHPPADVAPPHPRFAQRPVGERDAAGAAGGEEPRRGDPGHVDLVGLAPAEAQRVAADDRLEEGDVGRRRRATLKPIATAIQSGSASSSLLSASPSPTSFGKRK